MDPVYQAHGKKLGELIREAGLEQKELADIIDVSPQAVSRWVNGLGPPSVPNLLRLDRALGVNGRVFAIYGETKPRTTEEIIEAAMAAGLDAITRELTGAISSLEEKVNGEIRSQLADHEQRLARVATLQLELSEQVGEILRRRRRGGAGPSTGTASGY